MLDVRPEEEKDSVPVLLSQGFNGTPDHFIPVARHLAAQYGRRVLAVYDDHGIPSENPHALETPQDRKANAVFAALEQLGVEKVRGVGYSEGASTLVRAALRRPSYFQDLVLTHPAGMQGTESLFHIAMRTAIETMQGATHMVKHVVHDTGHKLRAAMAIKHRYVQDGKLSTAREVVALANEDLLPKLKTLREKHGKDVAVTSGRQDQLFRLAQVKLTAKRAGIPDELFLATPGSHLEHIAEPEVFADAVETLLKRLEDRRGS